MEVGFKTNIAALYVIKISKWFSLIMPIIVLFYKGNGLDIQDIMVLKSVYSIVSVTLEIPTGYLADSWGRKNCIIAGVILSFCGFVIYSFSSIFVAFIVAEIVLGIGQSLVSGADSALLYDSCVRFNSSDEYLKYEGRVTMVGNFAEAMAGIFSGFLATVSLRLPFYCQAGIAFLGIPAALILSDKNVVTKIANPISNITKIIKYSLIENKVLCCDILFSGIIGCATLTMAWFAQPILIEIATPTKWFGVIWTVLNLIVGISAYYSDYINSKIGLGKTYILIIIFITLGYVASAYFLSSMVSALVVLCFFYIVRGFATPILKGYINKQVFSDMRATVLSIRNFIIRLMFAIIAPFVGWLCDVCSLATALYVTGVIVFIPGIVIWLIQHYKLLNNG